MNAEAENCQARRWNAQMSRSEGWAAWLVRIVKGDSPIFVRRKSGQSPERGLGQFPRQREGRTPANANDTVILGWLEDGEETEDEEKYWRKTLHREQPPTPEARVDRADGVGQESREEASAYEAGMAGAAMAGEPVALEDHPSAATKTWPRKALSILSDLADAVRSFFKSLRLTDWLLLGAVVVLLLVVVMMVFPVTLTWGKAVVWVWKWPFWVWTCILVVVFGYLAWLRSRQE